MCLLSHYLSNTCYVPSISLVLGWTTAPPTMDRSTFTSAGSSAPCASPIQQLSKQRMGCSTLAPFPTSRQAPHLVHSFSYCQSHCPHSCCTGLAHRPVSGSPDPSPPHTSIQVPRASQSDSSTTLTILLPCSRL